MSPSTHNPTPASFNRDVSNSPVQPARRPVVLSLILLALLTLSGCIAADGTTTLPFTPPEVASSQNFGGVVESVLSYRVAATPTPDPAAQEEDALTVVVNTGGSRANVRSGPSLDAIIVAKADNGDVFEVLGKSDDEDWWQVTGIVGGTDGATEGWLSDSVVALGGESDAVAVTSGEALLDDNLEATWEINWECDSEEGRCTIAACDAVVTAGVSRPGNAQFIPVEYEVQWDDTCFSTDSWVFEVDPFTGRERTGEYADNFLYAYWTGANSGDISGVYPYSDDTGIVVVCSGPTTVEVEEGDGWTTSYEGTTCHDQRTGMLVYMDYVKRWLYTGEFEGETYERAYFGDIERLQQRLTETNVTLAEVEKR